MNAKEKNYIYYRIAKELDKELKYAIDDNLSFYQLDMRLINLVGKLAEAWNIKARHGQSKARTLWYRILEGSNLRAKRGSE